MRSRISKTVLVGVLVTALAACSSSGEVPTASATGTTAASIAPTTGVAAAPPSDETHVGFEGEVIDVRAKLVEQGFSIDRIDAIYTNAAYILVPYQKPSVMSKTHVVGDGNSTCTFSVRNATWEKGESLPSHQIFSGSTVRLVGYLHAGDGSKGPMLSTTTGAQSVDVPLTKLTPTWLTHESGFNLGSCKTDKK